MKADKIYLNLNLNNKFKFNGSYILGFKFSILKDLQNVTNAWICFES